MVERRQSSDFVKTLIQSIVVSAVFLSADTKANETFQVLHSSEVDKESFISMPSVAFLRKGSELKKGDVFRFDIQKFRKIAVGYARGIKGFSELVSSSVSMISNPDSDSGYYFLVVLIDKNKNCLRIVMNGEYEIWPLGKVHDPFK